MKTLLVRSGMMLFGIISVSVASGNGLIDKGRETAADSSKSALLSERLFKSLTTHSVSGDLLKDPDLPKHASKASLGKIPVSKNGEPVLFAVGTSITAGYRDGGLFRQGQLTAYPNLIAHQMGLTKFNSGAFSEKAPNGTGYLKIVNSNGVPEYHQINNDFANAGNNPVRLEKSLNASNLGIPFFDYSSVGISRSFVREQLVPNKHEEYESFKFFLRYATDDAETSRESPLSIINKDKHDIGLLEFGFSDYLKFYQTGGVLTDYNFVQNGAYPNLDILKAMGKGTVVMTVPEVLDLPYFHFVEAKDILAKNGSTKHINSWDGSLEKLNSDDIIVPGSNIVSFANESAFPSILSEESVLAVNERGFGIENYNKKIVEWAKQTGSQVFDLHALYKKVLNGSYVTDDGYKIDPDFRKGNFFSADGIHPSAIGQAVIANEIIKIINQNYQAEVPLIKVSEFARQFGK